MSALTVTLGADITTLKRAMAGATELVSASARRMARVTGAGLAGLGKGGSVRNFISDGAMWKGLGSVLLGLAALDCGGPPPL